MLSRLNDAAVVADPFFHSYIEEIFPANFYQELLQELPSDDFYEAYAPPYQARLSLNVNPTVAAGISEFWQRFELLINGPEILNGFAKLFSNALPSVYKFRADQIKENTVADDVQVSSRTLLNRDYAHFALGPHTDSTPKFITGIFYLAKDESLREFGTSIYAPKIEGLTSWNSRHFKHAEFDLLQTFPFLPNSIFVFMKSDKSFHGVQPGNYPNTGRDMLMWVPEIGKSKSTWGDLRLPKKMFEPQDGSMSPKSA